MHDIDQDSEVKVDQLVESVPTFIVFKNGKQVDRLTGSNQSGLEKLLERAAKSKDDESSSDGDGSS